MNRCSTSPSVSDCPCVLAVQQGFGYSVAFNSTTVHSLPMVVNVLSNALLRGLNSTARIRTSTKPFDYVSSASRPRLHLSIGFEDSYDIAPGVSVISHSKRFHPLRCTVDRSAYQLLQSTGVG